MLEETIGFVGELIRRNASVLNIIDSDFAFLNQPLAAHYGVDGVQGDQLRPVQLKPTHQLGGLLTQGSIISWQWNWLGASSDLPSGLAA